MSEVVRIKSSTVVVSVCRAEFLGGGIVLAGCDAVGVDSLADEPVQATLIILEAGSRAVVAGAGVVEAGLEHGCQHKNVDERYAKMN